MEQSQITKTHDQIKDTVEKPVIKGESLIFDEIDYADESLTTQELAIRPVPEDVRTFLETIPDTEMLKVEEMRKKYMQSFDITEEQYNKIAEEMLEEGYILG